MPNLGAAISLTSSCPSARFSTVEVLSIWPCDSLVTVMDDAGIVTEVTAYQSYCKLVAFSLPVFTRRFGRR